MTLRVAQGVGKFATDTGVNALDRVAQGVGKFATTSGVNAELRVAQACAKFAVRVYQVKVYPKIFPPFDTTISQAPYVRTILK